LPGVPDLLICDGAGKLHLVELKFTTSKVVALSPHQVSFLVKHKKASVWIMVYKSQVRKSNEQEVFLYHGKDAVDVRMEGLETEPVYYADATKDWSNILNLISKK
jgi:hypothetical protein